MERFKPVVYMEADREDKNPALLRFMRDEVGYTCVQHRVPLYNHANFRNADPWDDEVAWVRGRSVMSSHNVLCLHRQGGGGGRGGGGEEDDGDEDGDDMDDDMEDRLSRIQDEWGELPFGAPAEGESPRTVTWQ